jgi:hypothetical protein
MKKEKVITNFMIIYFVVGLLFATSFMIYYKWNAFAFLSFKFFSVLFTWPIQMIGFIADLQTYGLSGKPF